jgi:mxaJ protein
MFSRYRNSLAIVPIAALALFALWPSPREVLRVCAEPNAMPYSNRAGQGFENKLAELLARDRQAVLKYAWLDNRRGSFDEMLSRGDCDMVMGIPTTVESLRVSRPYYRSSYMLVSRADGPQFDSLDDPRLRSSRIGVQVVGDDFANTPAAFALADRNLLDHMAPFLMYSSDSGERPSELLIAAVASGDVDVAIEWGPQAGYFAARQPTKLTLKELPQEGQLLFSYPIGIAFSRVSPSELVAAVEQFLTRRQPEILALLDSYAIPHTGL